MGERVFNADHELLTCKCPVCGSMAFPYAGRYSNLTQRTVRESGLFFVCFFQINAQRG